jgi:hypothetical protein
MQINSSYDADGNNGKFTKAMKFPYGICLYTLYVKGKLFYADKSSYIKDLEEVGRQNKIWRPWRFEKSFICSMLKEYYDAANSVAQVLFLFYEHNEADITLHRSS